MADDTEIMAEEDREEAKAASESAPWLSMIKEGERAFSDWQDRCDKIDKLYADLAKLAKDNRDREFQLFWANIQVIGPSIYARPPVPVVVQRFKERRPVPRVAAELLERGVSVALDQEDIDGTMRLIRDDVAILSRGVPWMRYEKKSGEHATERVCVEWKYRKDFVHEPSRCWKEVGWVAAAAYLSKDEMKKRFSPHSGEAYLQAAYSIRKDAKDSGAADSTQKAKVWELWSKTDNKVVWVTEGVDKVLDEGPPHLKLDGFFPCPKPAYSTVQRGSLVPVPDVVFYKDQLEEINELTDRIHKLSDALKVKAFYPAGTGEIGDAIESAIKNTSNNRILVPVPNWAAFGNGSAKDMLVWLPIDMIATTIKELVFLRKQLIDDVYQISGISDVQRGETDPNETLGAQELKQSNGAVRIRDKRDELVRVARDIVRISAEIMAENFSPKTLLEMSQMELPTDARIAAQVKEIEQKALQEQKQARQQIAQAQQNPQIMAAAQANPEQAKQAVGAIEQKVQAVLAQLKQQAEQVSQTVTIEQVMKLLKEQRLRPFVLDIETDSTIAPDENAQKQRATEFITAVGGFLNQAMQGIEQVPQIAPLMAETLKYVASQFRAGRQLDTAIDEFADQMKQMGQQPKPNPEAEAMQAKAAMEKETHQADMANKKLDMETKQTDLKTKVGLAQLDVKNKTEQQALTLANMREKHQQDMEKGALEIQRLKVDIVGKAMPEPQAEAEAKPPSESIAFKDLPPEGQSQMAAQAGIDISPERMAAHQAEQDAKKQAETEAKMKAKEPA